MPAVKVVSTEITTRTTFMEVPAGFDATNEDHRAAVDEAAMDHECGEDGIERSITIEPAIGACAIDAVIDDDDLDRTTPRHTWTFFGHWDCDALVIEYVREGKHTDDREDTGYWEQGMWCDTATAATKDEALQMLRDEYESSNS